MRRLALLLFAGCQIVFPLQNPPPDADLRMQCSSQPLSCPTDYLALPGSTSFYKQSTIDGDNFLGAAAACKVDGGGAPNGFTHLAVPDDMAELTAISAAINDTDRWLGIRREALGGSFTTVTGQTGFPPDSGPPWSIDPSSGSSCVVYQPDGRLLATACSDIHQFVCECDCNDPRD